MKKNGKEFDVEQATKLVDRMLEDASTDPQGKLDEVAAYMQPLKRFPRITQPEHYLPLFERYRNGDEVERGRARDLLVYGNMRLVLKVALGYQRGGASILDMMQEGTTGLMRAIEKFDPEKGFRFSTYAVGWVRQAMERAVHNCADKRGYRIPVHYGELLSALGKAFGEVYLRKGRAPREIEIYQQIKASGTKVSERITLVDVKEGLQAIAMGTPVRLDAPMSEDEGEESFGNVMVGAPPKTETLIEARRLYLEYREAVDRIEAGVAQMPARTAMVLRLRLGLGEFDIMTLEEIGERYEITRERVRQIEGKALTELGQKLEIEPDQIGEIVRMMEELEVVAHAL